MAQKKPTGGLPAKPIADRSSDMRRLIGEAGKHTARTIAILQDMMVVDVASQAALTGLLHRYGDEIPKEKAAKLALDYGIAYAEERMRRLAAAKEKR